MAANPDEVTKERALALKASIRLLADHSERAADERQDLAEFAIELVDRVLDQNGKERS